MVLKNEEPEDQLELAKKLGITVVKKDDSAFSLTVKSYKAMGREAWFAALSGYIAAATDDTLLSKIRETSAFKKIPGAPEMTIDALIDRIAKGPNDSINMILMQFARGNFAWADRIYRGTMEKVSLPRSFESYDTLDLAMEAATAASRRLPDEWEGKLLQKMGDRRYQYCSTRVVAYAVASGHVPWPEMEPVVLPGFLGILSACYAKQWVDYFIRRGKFHPAFDAALAEKVKNFGDATWRDVASVVQVYMAAYPESQVGPVPRV